MIQLKPYNIPSPECISCGLNQVKTIDILFQGIHILQDCTCDSCGHEFYATLPISHDYYFPVKFSKDRSVKIFNPQVKDWHAEPLINSFNSESDENFEIEVKSIQEKKEVVLLNCLDNCFGHFLSRLFNAQSLLERHKELGLVVLLPEKFQWLLPDGISEAWLFKGSLKDCGKLLTQLDGFVKKQMERFDKVFLSKALYLNPYLFLDLGKMLRTKPFEIEQFHKTAPVITFVLREDRFWHNSRVMEFIFRVSVKFGIGKLVKPIFIWRQNQLISRTVNKLSNDFQNVSFYATGLGKAGGLDEKVKDLRKDNTSYEDERNWISLFSKSHLVVGVHGSNMIIPTSLSGGFIDIVPRFKIPNWAEDTVLTYHPGLSNFLGRYLDEFSSPSLVYLHVKNMLTGFEYNFLSMIEQPE